MTNYPKAQFTKISDEYDGAEWPDSSHRIVTQIDGELADKIRAHYGKAGTVTLIEDGKEGGWSEFTIEWSWDCELRIGDEKVWGRDDDYSEIDPVDGDAYYLDKFMKLIAKIIEGETR